MTRENDKMSTKHTNKSARQGAAKHTSGTAHKSGGRKAPSRKQAAKRRRRRMMLFAAEIVILLVMLGFLSMKRVS